MANIKRFYIRGYMDHEKLEDDANKDVLAMLGTFSLPTNGFNVIWTGETTRPNEHGGKTCLFHYIIQGTEAVSWTFLDNVVKKLRKLGEVSEARAQDYEETSPWQTIGLTPD